MSVYQSTEEWGKRRTGAERDSRLTGEKWVSIKGSGEERSEETGRVDTI